MKSRDEFENEEVDNGVEGEIIEPLKSLRRLRTTLDIVLNSRLENDEEKIQQLAELSFSIDRVINIYVANNKL